MAAAVFLLATVLAIVIGDTEAIRFVIDRKECFSHMVPYDAETVRVSFVVVKSDNDWAFEHAGVDLVVEGPGGYQVHDVRHKSDDKFEFVATKSGLYKFCFYNLSPVHETVWFDVQVGHFSGPDEHATDEHIDPLLGQVARLEDALYSVSFEQHWLQAMTERQAQLNTNMSKRVIYKAILEGIALISASFLQVLLMRRLFEKKLGNSRV